ncbi:MAG TPA: hypothetical protein VMV49_09695, partial [Candidatus Deferrimicrobium sp.]|nr:hypothetical protein [Candidatus Deferrimicrobium sp.]
QGSIGYFILKIDPPRESNSLSGVHQFNVTIRSRGDPSVKDSITENLNILPYYNVKVERTSLLETGILDIEPEVTANISFSVTNTGNTAETFLLSMTTNELDSSIFEVPSSVYLDPGESKIITPNITVPRSSEFPALCYSVKLTARSQTNPSSSAYDTVQMNITPYKNLSVSCIEKYIPAKIRPGDVLEYEVNVKNNGNFNDTIELSLLGISISSYEFGIEEQILFPGQEFNTTLKITIPRTANSIKSETYNLTFFAQFASNEIIRIEQSLVIQTSPNYLPFIVLIIAVGSIIASTPYLYKKTAPYVKRKWNTRIIRKYTKKSEGPEIRIRLETCPHCFKDLTKGEINALNSKLDTLCEKCGNIVKPEYLEVSIPMQKSIDEVVSEKMKKYKEKKEKVKEKDSILRDPKREIIKPKKIIKINLEESRLQVRSSSPKVIEIKYCPHCFQNLASTDINILSKGDMTFCSHCRKIVKPDDFGIKGSK